MTRRPVHVPGQSAPAPGTYEQINVFGTPTGYGSTSRMVNRFRRRPSAMAGRLWKKTRPLMRTRKAFGWFRSDYSKLIKAFSNSGLSSTVRAVTLRSRPSRSNLVNARVTVSAEVPR